MTPRNRTRLRAVSLLLVALLFGGLLGALAMGAYVKHRLAPVADFNHPERLAARIEAFIAPRDEVQRREIRPILERASREASAGVAQFRRELAEVFDQMERDLAPHLSTEQQRRLVERRESLQRRAQRK